MDRDAFHVFDTTLRDGAQREGISYSVSDKLAVARLLDELGVGFIEGGWPGAMPKDTEFFARAAAGELKLANAQLVAFGATRKPGINVADDAQVRALLDSQAPVVCLVAKSDVRHVKEALRTTNEENLAMVRDTVDFFVRNGRRVFVDCEHFFDGYKHDPRLRRDAAEDGVRRRRQRGVMCDTNGGMLPLGIYRTVERRARALGRPAGDPLPGRHVLRGREHPGGRRGRGHPRAVHGQRVRRAHRQRRPVLRGRQPRAEAGDQGPARGQPARVQADQPRPGRHRQPPAGHPPGVRRGLVVRAQGRAARLGAEGQRGAVQPHRPAAGRQRHPDPGHRDGRPGDRRAQGPRARAWTSPRTPRPWPGSSRR